MFIRGCKRFGLFFLFLFDDGLINRGHSVSKRPKTSLRICGGMLLFSDSRPFLVFVGLLDGE